MASLRKYNTLVYSSNIIICCLILFDTYFTSTNIVKEKCIKKEVVINRSRNRTWSSWQVTTSKNIIYSIPEDSWESINVNDSFLLHSSCFLGATKGITYRDKVDAYYIRLAPLYGRLPGLILTLAPLLTSVVLLFYTVRLKKLIELRHALALAIISLLILYTYLASQA